MQRLGQLSAWLASLYPGAVGEILPASEDAGFRRYFRVSIDGTSRIVMDAPPARENCLPFLQVGEVLRTAGVHVPEVYAQDLTQGFLLGFVVAALLFGLLAGVLIDRLGSRQVIRIGIWCVGLPLILMGSMTRLWQYYLLCIMEVIGYVLTGPIPNQVLISNWFRLKRGRAMGGAYLGLGVGGAISPLLINALIQSVGWRHAFENELPRRPRLLHCDPAEHVLRRFAADCGLAGVPRLPCSRTSAAG